MNDPVLALAFPLGGREHVGGGPAYPGRPVDPGYGQGQDPGHPWLPGHGGGMNGGHIDNSLPVPPLPPALNPPPPQIWPPTAPIFPAGPDNELPPPGAIWPPLPPTAAGELVLVLVYITGNGWHWVVLDPEALPPEAATKPITPPPPAPKA